MNTIKIEIRKNETGYTAVANGEKIGWVCSWFNNTFAAAMSFGIRTIKSLAITELDNEEKSANGFMTETNAILWFKDMITSYFKKHNIKAEFAKV